MVPSILAEPERRKGELIHLQKEVPPKHHRFIVTLATMTVIDGLRYGVNSTGTFQGYSSGLVSLGQGSILGVPNVFILAVVVACYQMAQMFGWRSPIGDLAVSGALVAALVAVFAFVLVSTRRRDEARLPDETAGQPLQ